MKEDITYTALVQILGYLTLINDPMKRNYGRKFFFIPAAGVGNDRVRIHVHNEAARLIERVFPERTHVGNYIRVPMATEKEFTTQWFIVPQNWNTVERVVVFRKRQTPGKKRPYYSIIGNKSIVQDFLAAVASLR
jgi:hypothetical protein